MDFTFVYQIFLSVLSLLILVVPCFILAKSGTIGEGAEKALSAVVLYVCQPTMLFMSFQKTAFSTEIIVNMLVVFGLALAVHGVMIAIVVLAFRGTDARKRCLRFSSVFSNCGYMGIPFLQMLYGGSAIIGEITVYAGVVIGAFNLLAWTVGVYLMTGDKREMSVKKAVLNPNIIALTLGVLLFVTIKRPFTELAADGSELDAATEKLVKSLIFFSDMVTPLSMSVIGIKLSKISVKKLFASGSAYVAAAMKLIVMSVVTTLVVAFLPVSESVKNVLFFTLSMPTATMTVLLSVRYDSDAESATANVLLSTALSVATVPLMYMLFSILST